VSSENVAHFLLVRHGQSEWNAKGRMQGHADSPLTPEGRRQATAAAHKLGSFDVVACSDLSRSRDTAQIIAEHLGLDILDPHPGLREIDVGPWQGLTRKQIAKQYPGFMENDMRPAGYESDDDVYDRVSGTLLRIATTYSVSTGLVVTHSGVLRILRRRLGMPDQRNHRNLEGCWFSMVVSGNAPGRLTVRESVNVLENSTASETL
jgi:broad specificity phosphatase PhoE